MCIRDRTVPNWMKIADVTLELRTGEEGEPLATAQLAADDWYSSGEETMMHTVWNGTFYKDDGPNKWLYACLLYTSHRELVQEHVQPEHQARQSGKGRHH